MVGDKTNGAEHGEVAGDGGPAEAEEIDEVADAALAGGEFGDDEHARRVTEGLESGGLTASGGAAFGKGHEGSYYAKMRNNEHVLNLSCALRPERSPPEFFAVGFCMGPTLLGLIRLD